MKINLLKPAEVASTLRVTEKTLTNWRSLRIGPPFIRVQGGVVRYRAEDFDQWLNEQAEVSRNWMAS